MRRMIPIHVRMSGFVRFSLRLRDVEKCQGFSRKNEDNSEKNDEIIQRLFWTTQENSRFNMSIAEKAPRESKRFKIILFETQQSPVI